jgi:hypothetical protein
MATLLPSITISTAMRLPSLRRPLLCAFFACACSAAFAQYAWIDANGVKQYSDMPPPAGVPASRILKMPGAATPPAETAPPAASAPATPSLSEREADYEKRRAAALEKQQAAERQAKIDENRKTVCEAARSQKRALDSGERLWRIDASGERHYLDDAERAGQARDVQRILDGCK